jgi:hypothetical protein
VNIILNNTKQQAEDMKDALCPLKYDEATGEQYRIVPEWLSVLYYFAKDADGIDNLVGSTLF